MDESQIRSAAREVHGWLQDAASDMAYSFKDGGFFGDTKYKKLVKDLRSAGVKGDYIWDAMADHIYGDEDFLSDLSGDKIHDLCRGVDEDMIKVAKEIIKMAHPPLERALEKHIERWEKR